MTPSRWAARQSKERRSKARLWKARSPKAGAPIPPYRLTRVAALGVSGAVLAAGLVMVPVALIARTAAPAWAADGTRPGFLDVCSHEPGTIDNGGECVHATLSAINHERASEGIGPMSLPASYPTLAADAQLLSIVDRERVDRGLPPLVGTTSDLDTDAQSGANTRSDPAVTAPPYADGRWQGTSTEAADLSQALGADYFWMYRDGWGGSSDTTFNTDCTSANAGACWSHRRAILAAFDPGLHLSMGAAVNATAADGYPVWTTVLMATTGRPPGYISTWSDLGTQAAWSDVGSPCGSDVPTGKIDRVAGGDRDATAIMASTRAYPQPDSADVVVLASDANFPDALAAGPLAVAKHGPLLITPPDALTSSVRAEIQRVVPPAATVYVAGGSLAVSPSVDATLRQDGYAVTRLAGSDRYETAVAIANARGNPTTAIEVTGQGFADALAAAPAATAIDAALLLTDGPQQASATATYMALHPGRRYAIGGAASAADPLATSIAGADRYATAVAVSKAFLPDATTLGFAAALSFPDALAGGPVAARLGGALVLVPGCGALPSDLESYLSSVSQSVVGGWLFGGGRAVGDDVLAQIEQALTPAG
ncbi:MAG: cell wall-binding repeat-containing protein [Acidimicrobiales bacterium]